MKNLSVIMNSGDLHGYMEELMRRAIATKLKLRRDRLVASPEAQAALERWLHTVIAIAANLVVTRRKAGGFQIEDDEFHGAWGIGLAVLS